MSDAQDEQTRVSLVGVPGVLKRQAWDGRVLVQMGSSDQEEEFARRYSAQGAKRAIPPERGVWVDLSRFDYHFVDHRVSQDTIGLMSEGGSLNTKCSYRSRGRGVISKLLVFLLSLTGSTPVNGCNGTSLISPLEA